MQHKEGRRRTETKKLEIAAHVSGYVAAEGKNPQTLLNSISNSKAHQCVTFPAKVANYQTDIILDSGSGITVMRFDLFNMINKYSKSPLAMSYNHVLARTP